MESAKAPQHEYGTNTPETNVSFQTLDEAVGNKNRPPRITCDKKYESSRDDPCIFAWFAGPAGTVFKPRELTTYLTPFITENQYWEASTDMSAGYSRKTGLVATSPGAAIEFEFPAIDKEVRYINLMILKS